MTTTLYSSSDAHMSSSPSSSSSSSSSSLFSAATSPSSRSSSSSPSPRIHPHSLVDASLHSPHTLRLVGISITQHLIDYAVDQVIDTVDRAMNRQSTLLPVSSSSKSTSIPSRPRTPSQQKFNSFATTVLTRAEITTPTLLLTLIYINRARPYLHIALEEWALERVFLGALIVASKYANDSTLKNVHWALCTGVFGKRDVGRIEREFLAVLEWELGVKEDDVLGLWEGLEWAVEEKEKEEREKQAKLEKEKLRQLGILERQRQQQQKASSSKFFLYSGGRSTESSASSSPVEVPPPLPVKPRNHRRSNAPAPLAVNVSAAAAPTHTASRTHGHSPSSMSSSSSSSSDSPSPSTPEDFQMQYVVIEDGDADDHRKETEVVAQQPTQKKRGFGATTIELLKSFPFPHHHQQCSKKHDREFSLPHPYAYTQSQQSHHGRYATEGSQRPVKRLPLRSVS